MSELPSKESLPAVDAAWLRMDSATNAMVINALLVFSEAPAFERIQELVSERLLRHRRFRQRVVEPKLGLPYFELDPHFDVKAHVHHVALPEPRDQRALEALVSDLTSAPLPRDRALWQLHVIDGVGEGTALLARLHHAMGDGVALVRLLLGLTDEGAVLSPPEVGVDVPRPEGLAARARLASAQAATLGRLLFLPQDTETSLKGELGTQKSVAWSERFSLDEVKAVARKHEAKVNDVLVAALTAALRSYLGTLEPGSVFRALVPVYVKQEEAGHDLGNHFGLVYVDLPIHEPDAPRRLALVRAAFDQIKREPDAIVALGVLGAMGVATSELEHIGIQLFTKKATVMITNVPGPPVEIHLAGKRLSELLVWAPVSGHIAVGLSLLSYAGGVRLGVFADVKRMPDPERLVQSFRDELVALTSTAR